MDGFEKWERGGLDEKDKPLCKMEGSLVCKYNIPFAVSSQKVLIRSGRSSIFE